MSFESDGKTRISANDDVVIEMWRNFKYFYNAGVSTFASQCNN